MPSAMPDVSRETQEYLSSLYCQNLSQSRNLPPAPGATRPSGPAAHILTLPTTFALGVVPQEPLPYTQRPCHIWGSTDFSLGSEQGDLGVALTLMRRLEEPPTPSSRDGPRNLSITSNFVSPAVAKD